MREIAIGIAGALAFSSPVFAEDEIVTTVQQGEVVPFTGTLLNPAAAARILADVEISEARCDALITKEVGLVQAERQREIDILNARLGTCEFLSESRLELLKNQNDFLLNEIQRYEKPREIWWFAGGTVVGTALAVGIVYALAPAM